VAALPWRSRDLAVRELVPASGTGPGHQPGAPTASRRPRRSPPLPWPAISFTTRWAVGLCGLHDGRSTSATAVRADPVPRHVRALW